MKPKKGQKISERFQELADEYGEIIHMHIGMGMDVVFLTGTDVSYVDIIIRMNGLHFLTLKSDLTDYL